MADLLETAAIAHEAWRKASRVQSITYARATASAALSATVGRSELTVTSSAGVETVESTDFIIAVADLELSGSATVPMLGDTIAYDGDTYEVMNAGGQAAYRFTEYKLAYRIHCKRVHA